MPLLRGQVAVDQVRIAGLRASVIRAKGGKFDFEDLMGTAAAGKPTAPGAEPGKVQFDIAGIQVERGTLADKDEGTGQTLEVAHLELRTGRIAEDVPGKMSLGALVKGKNPLVDLKIALESGYRLSPSRQEYALTGLNLRVDGAAAQFSRLALLLTGDVRAELAKESVHADLTAKFEETTVKAKATLTDFDAPHYGFDVDVDKVNLDRYLAASPKAKPTPGAGAKVDVDVPVAKQTVRGKLVNRTKDGRLITVEGSANPILDEEHRIVGFMGIQHDITKRKESEGNLKANERFLSTIFASIQDGISVLDTDMRIVQVNAKMQEWYAHAMPLIGKKCHEAYHGSSKPCAVCPVKQTLETKKTSREIVPLTGADRATLGWLELFSFPLLDEGTGQTKGVIEYVRDISEKKRG